MMGIDCYILIYDLVSSQFRVCLDILEVDSGEFLTPNIIKIIFLFFEKLMNLVRAGTYREIVLGSRDLRFARIAVLCDKVAGRIG